MHVNDNSRRSIERFIRPAETLPVGKTARAGAKAGVFGGVVMLILLAGYGSLIPFRITAYVITGSASFADSAAGTVLAGAAFLIWSIGLGAVYGLIIARFIGRVGILTAACCGAVFGLLAWMVSQYVVIGCAAPNLATVNNQPLLAGVHLVFGLCLGFLGNFTDGRGGPH